ncbi:NB-ARC domain-containing protein [Kribbella sp. NBC_01505]|uniref:NB-ARC domain-containing protein n=1 Tax=Kribbella sp. NBC_01505 TaxID=2903580 RepID=UPI0038638512
MPDFGPVLRTFRKAAGLSQERLAAASGVSVEAIKTLEAGRRRFPWAQTVDLLAQGLQLTSEERAELKAAAVRPKANSGGDMLPAEVADFVGRVDQIAAVSGLLTGGGREPGVVVISALAGMGGVGKTALAVRVAREVAGRFADGVLYLNLRGFGVGEPMAPLEALSALLRQLGFVLQQPPASVDEAAGLFRTACATRKLLVVLDNAVSVEQVMPLLPGTSSCAVIVTSRRAMVGLPGAQPLTLAVLPQDEALALLTSAAGRDRIGDDPQAALEVVALCGSLPLALRIAGTRLAAESSWTVADLARRLSDETARLDVLGGTESGVRASIALSLTGTSAQDAAAAEVFGLLGLHQGEDLDLKVAARLVDRPEAEVETLLEHLVDLHLLDSSAPRRYQFHDLVRAYAQELAEGRTSPAERAAAHDRVIALYVAMVWRLRSFYGLGQLSREWVDEGWFSEAEELEKPQVLDWLDAEADEILAAAQRLAAGPRSGYASIVRIAVPMATYWRSRRRETDGVRMGVLAVTAMRDDPTCVPPQAFLAMSYHLACHYHNRSDFESAILHMTASVEGSVVQGQARQQLYSLLALSQMLERAHRFDESLARGQVGLELALSAGDEAAEGEARANLGVLAGRRGEWAEQDREFELAEALYRRTQLWDLLSLVEVIVRSYRGCGRAGKARDLLRRVLDDVRENTGKFVYADCLELLGATEVELESYDTARVHLEEALSLVGDTSAEFEARIRHSLGMALSGLGEAEPAREQWLVALELYRRYGLPQAAEVLELLELVDDGEDGQEAEGEEGEG